MSKVEIKRAFYNSCIKEGMAIEDVQDMVDDMSGSITSQTYAAYKAWITMKSRAYKKASTIKKTPKKSIKPVTYQVMSFSLGR